MIDCYLVKCPYELGVAIRKDGYWTRCLAERLTAPGFSDTVS